MAKRASQGMIDAALLYIKSRATHYVLLSGSAASYGEIASLTLGKISIDSTGFGQPSGDAATQRLINIKAASFTPTKSGQANHLALVNETAQELIFLDEIANPLSVVISKVVNMASWNIRLNAPA